MSFKEETMGYFAYQNNTQMYNILKTPNYLAKPENKQTIKKYYIHADHQMLVH